MNISKMTYKALLNSYKHFLPFRCKHYFINYPTWKKVLAKCTRKGKSALVIAHEQTATSNRQKWHRNGEFYLPLLQTHLFLYKHSTKCLRFTVFPADHVLSNKSNLSLKCDQPLLLSLRSVQFPSAFKDVTLLLVKAQRLPEAAWVWWEGSGKGSASAYSHMQTSPNSRYLSSSRDTVHQFSECINGHAHHILVIWRKQESPK